MSNTAGLKFAAARGAERIYTIAKNTAVDTLGGPRAFQIQGPSIRRMAIAAAILDLLTMQDDTIAAETVQRLTLDLHELLFADSERGWVL